jgi:hypothetical protein
MSTLFILAQLRIGARNAFSLCSLRRSHPSRAGDARQVWEWPHGLIPQTVQNDLLRRPPSTSPGGGTWPSSAGRGIESILCIEETLVDQRKCSYGTAGITALSKTTQSHDVKYIIVDVASGETIARQHIEYEAPSCPGRFGTLTSYQFRANYNPSDFAIWLRAHWDKWT